MKHWKIGSEAGYENPVQWTGWETEVTQVCGATSRGAQVFG